VLGAFATALLMAFGAWRISRHPLRSFAWMLMYGMGNALLLAVITRMAGPFTFVPALACVVVMSVMAYPQFEGWRAWVLIGMLLVGVLVPIGVESAGYIARTWDLEHGTLVSHAGALEIGGYRTIVLLLGASIASIVIAGRIAARIYGTSREAQHRLATQAWHLRQLLPAARS
jgi:hypothetical protein